MCDLIPLTIRLGEEDSHQFLLGLREQSSHSLIQRILVLEEPAIHVVHDSSSIVIQLKVSLILGCLANFGLPKVGRFAQVVLIQHSLQGLIGGLGEHALFLQNGQDTQRLKKRDMENLDMEAEGMTSYCLFCFASRMTYQFD